MSDGRTQIAELEISFRSARITQSWFEQKLAARKMLLRPI